jgi:hypothetical protein
MDFPSKVAFEKFESLKRLKRIPSRDSYDMGSTQRFEKWGIKPHYFSHLKLKHTLIESFTLCSAFSVVP